MSWQDLVPGPSQDWTSSAAETEALDRQEEESKERTQRHLDGYGKYHYEKVQMAVAAYKKRVNGKRLSEAELDAEFNFQYEYNPLAEQVFRQEGIDEKHRYSFVARHFQLDQEEEEEEEMDDAKNQSVSEPKLKMRPATKQQSKRKEKPLMAPAPLKVKKAVMTKRQEEKHVATQQEHAQVAVPQKTKDKKAIESDHFFIELRQEFHGAVVGELKGTEIRTRYETWCEAQNPPHVVMGKNTFGALVGKKFKRLHDWKPYSYDVLQDGRGGAKEWQLQHAVAALPVPMAIETPSTQDANMQARLDALDAEEESIPAEEPRASPEADLKHRLSALNAN